MDFRKAFSKTEVLRMTIEQFIYVK